MKLKTRALFAILTLLFVLGLGAVAVNHGAGSRTTVPSASEEGEHEHGGPDQERWYFAHWHQQYGAELPADVVREAWKEIDQLPSEQGSLATTGWQLLGPSGMTNITSPGARYSGRVLDVELLEGRFRAAAASGGLWQTAGSAAPIPLSDNLQSLAIGAFATIPGTGGNRIIVGTGEPRLRSGIGLFTTTDGGANWIHCNLSPDPTGFYQIRFTPGRPGKIHVASNTGYYRSDDGGVTWTQYLSGNCSDVAVSGAFPNVVYAAIWGDGVYASGDNGTTWAKIGRRGIPTANVGRTSISMSPSTNAMYIQMTRFDNENLLGIFRTVNGGGTWQNVTPPSNIVGVQGWYDNVVGVSPANPDVGLAGGVGLWRTSDGGVTWSQIQDPNVHADQHSIQWVDGNTVYVGNDGGVCVSTDAGLTWTSTGNTFPITQYVNLAAGVNNENVIFGGSQDNGFSGTTDGGATWSQTAGGDGGGVTIDPSDASRIWGTLGVYGPPWSFRRHRSTDTGQTWDNTINNGIDPSTQWFTVIRNDQAPPVNLYTNSDNWVYKSTDSGSSWTKLNGTPFSASLSNLNMTGYYRGDVVIYASLMSAAPPGPLEVYTGGAWSERSNGLPSNVILRGVAVHETDHNKAYALIAGLLAGEKVYKTTNRGLSWTNISGDLPNVPPGDLVPHPTDDNTLYLGTEFGCYRTTNGGVNWERWDAGMPEASIVTEMTSIDRRGIDGTFYIVAATYGRGIWKREINDIDLSGVADPGGSDSGRAGANANASAIASIRSAPNPFEASTSITFSLPKAGVADLRIYDVTGREVMTLADGAKTAGEHTVSFDGSKLPAGSYWLRLKSGGWTTARKVVRVAGK